MLRITGMMRHGTTGGWMMPDKTGGPAFPSDGYERILGMSLRDWFAGQVLNGVITGILTNEKTARWFNDQPNASSAIADYAGGIADAMLKERANA